VALGYYWVGNFVASNTSELRNPPVYDAKPYDIKPTGLAKEGRHGQVGWQFNFTQVFFALQLAAAQCGRGADLAGQAAGRPGGEWGGAVAPDPADRAHIHSEPSSF
jgi:hypothetical protein